MLPPVDGPPFDSTDAGALAVLQGLCAALSEKIVTMTEHLDNALVSLPAAVEASVAKRMPSFVMREDLHVLQSECADFMKKSSESCLSAFSTQLEGSARQ